MDIEARADDLLRAPLGCAFLLIVEASGLTPEVATRPAVSVRIAAVVVRELSVWRSNHAALVTEVLSRGGRLRRLAQALLSQRGAAWWFARSGARPQVWISRNGLAPARDRFVVPQAPLRDWERYAQKSAVGLYTSTLVDDTSSVFAALAEGAGDYNLESPIRSWRLDPAPTSRIFDIDSPRA